MHLQRQLCDKQAHGDGCWTLNRGRLRKPPCFHSTRPGSFPPSRGASSSSSSSSPDRSNRVRFRLDSDSPSWQASLCSFQLRHVATCSFRLSFSDKVLVSKRSRDPEPQEISTDKAMDRRARAAPVLDHGWKGERTRLSARLGCRKASASTSRACGKAWCRRVGEGLPRSVGQPPVAACRSGAYTRSFFPPSASDVLWRSAVLPCSFRRRRRLATRAFFVQVVVSIARLDVTFHPIPSVPFYRTVFPIHPKVRSDQRVDGTRRKGRRLGSRCTTRGSCISSDTCGSSDRTWPWRLPREVIARIRDGRGADVRSTRGEGVGTSWDGPRGRSWWMPESGREGSNPRQWDTNTAIGTSALVKYHPYSKRKNPKLDWNSSKCRPCKDTAAVHHGIRTVGPRTKRNTTAKTITRPSRKCPNK